MGGHGPFRSRICLVTDIENYSTHKTPQQDDVQRRLLRITQFALGRARIFRVARQERQDRGDGQLLLMPPRVDQTLAVPALVGGLRHALHLNNRDPGESGRIRMRVAVAQGAIAQGATGFRGQATTVVCRLVDSQLLKDALRDHTEADLAFAVPDDFYKDVVQQDYPGLPSGDFTPMTLSSKEYTGNAWVYLPESGPALDAADSAALWLGVGGGVVVTGLGLALSTSGPPDDDQDPDEDDPSDDGTDLPSDTGPGAPDTVHDQHTAFGPADDGGTPHQSDTYEASADDPGDGSME